MSFEKKHILLVLTKNMKIVIKNFRCYKEKTTFEFPDGQISLLTGASGIGKTTIFEAIAWCLYDKIQHVYPHGHKSEKIMVTIYLNNIKIKRTKPPSVLEIELENGDKLTDNSAQEYIYSLFGSRDLWYASSYISQGEKNPILTLSNSKKFELLYELTFGNQEETENPELYIQKIEDELEISKKLIMSETKSYEAFSETYNSLKNKYKIEETYTHEDLEELNISISKLKKKIDILKIEVQSEIDQQNLKKKLYLDLENLDKKKNEIINSQLQISIDELIIKENNCLIGQKVKQITDRINFLIQNIPINSDLLKKQLEINKLCKERDKLFIIKDHLKFDNTENIINIYREEKIILEQLSKYPDEDEILKEMDKYNKYNNWIEETKQIKETNKKNYAAYLEQLENIDKLIELNSMRKKEYKKLVDEYEKFSENKKLIEEINKYEYKELSVEELQNLIYEIKLELKEIFCPHCQQGLIFTNGTLKKGKSNTSKKEENELKLNTLESVLSLKKKVIKYETEIYEPMKPSYFKIEEISEPEEIKIPKEPPKGKNYDYSEYVRLKNLKKLNFNVGEISEQIKSLENVKRYKELENFVFQELKFSEKDVTKIKKYEIELENLKDELLNLKYVETNDTLENIRSQILKIQNDNKSLEIYENEISEKTEKLNSLLSISDSKPKLEKYISKLEHLEKTLIDAKNSIFVEEHKGKMEKHQKLMNKYTIYEGNLIRLKKFFVETSTNSILEILESINITANQLLEQLFDEDIFIRLNTHKELKSKKGESKLQVNLEIEYNSVIYDSLNMLSGGELSRISFALTLAINKITGISFILLDESFAGLNSDLRDRSLDLLKSNFHGVTIINICHEITEGHHDEIIRL